MKKALVFGGSGQIGAAAAQALADAEWQVTAVTRDDRPLPPSLTDRGVTLMDGNGKTRSQVIKECDGPFDAVVDPTSYDAGDAQDLLGAEHCFGALTVLSSCSVYADPAGRSLDEAGQTGFPEFPLGITEDTATVPPGPETYSTRKVAMEKVLEHARTPVTILRPCAVYGRHARALRESWFLKRMHDGRAQIPIA